MAEGYSWKRTLAIVAVLIVALVVVGIVAGGKSANRGSGPYGTIFISSATDPNAPFLSAYTIGVNDGSITRMGADDTSGGTFYTFTHDATTVAFAGITDERLWQAVDHKIPAGQVTQLYRAQLRYGAIRSRNVSRETSAPPTAMFTIAAQERSSRYASMAARTVSATIRARRAACADQTVIYTTAAPAPSRPSANGAAPANTATIRLMASSKAFR